MKACTEFDQVRNETSGALEKWDNRDQAALLVQLVESVVQTHATQCREKLKANMLASTTAVQKSFEELRQRAYAGKNAGVAWSQKLKASSPLAKVQSEAQESGLLALDEDALVAASTDAKDKFDAYKAAHGVAGEQAAAGVEEAYSTLSLRATQSMVEKALVNMTLEPNMNKDALRVKIQTEVKKIRAHGVREKDVLPAALFKWAFSSLTSRR